LNVIADAYKPEIEAALEPFVYELVGAPKRQSYRCIGLLTAPQLNTRAQSLRNMVSVVTKPMPYITLRVQLALSG
jgi:hypothetical protein